MSTSTSTLFPTTGFTEGSKGPGILFLQMLLFGGGLTNEGKLIPDGDWGTNTTEALKSYQALSQLRVTGHFDAQTRNQLNDDLRVSAQEFDLNSLPALPGESVYVPIPGEVAEEEEDEDEKQDGSPAGN